MVSRVCLNMLQARRSRPESPFGEEFPEPAAADPGADPEYEAVPADSVGLALMVVLDTLTPAERVAFVLHDMFADGNPGAVWAPQGRARAAIVMTWSQGRIAGIEIVADPRRLRALRSCCGPGGSGTRHRQGHATGRQERSRS